VEPRLCRCRDVHVCRVFGICYAMQSERGAERLQPLPLILECRSSSLLTARSPDPSILLPTRETEVGRTWVTV
jgi:hypothetical protein